VLDALLACDAYLCGLALTVALIVYPSFHLVGAGQWGAFHRHHLSRITWAVGPAWALQGALSLWWVARGPHRGLAATHLLLAGVAVVATVVGAMPRHGRLERHHDVQDVRGLQGWNWLRSAAWVAAAVVTLVAL
jgi:hypothetical protein